VPSVTIHLSYDAVSRYAELLRVLSFTIKLIMLRRYAECYYDECHGEGHAQSSFAHCLF
jgi:hypothetical protein